LIYYASTFSNCRRWVKEDQVQLGEQVAAQREQPFFNNVLVGPREPESLRKRLSVGVHQQILQLLTHKSGFMNVEALTNAILRRMFVELDIYYHKRLRDGFGGTRPARELLRSELARLIRKHQGKSILIVAHSMGAIIAYDVLLHVTPEIPIDTLVTLGAPLGFPVITKKIRQELGRDPESDTPLPTPPSITRKWLNFADLDDVTCLNYNLRHLYAENGHGVRPFDQIVFNNYEYQGERNPHKNYGYLRTPEVAEALYHFLVLENAGWWQRLKWVFRRPVM